MHLRHDMVSCFVVRPASSGISHEFLQLKRASTDFMGGTWQTIYGRIEPAETAVAAALRELHEETRMIPAEFYQLDQVHIFYVALQDTLWHCVQFCAVVKPDDAVILNEEHNEFRWLPTNTAAENFMWPGDRTAVREIQQEILIGGMAKQFMRIPLPKV